MVNDDFSDREREIIFRACLVEVAEIHTYTDRPIFLLNGDDASDPIRILLFTGEFGFDELFSLLDHLFF